MPSQSRITLLGLLLHAFSSTILAQPANPAAIPLTDEERLWIAAHPPIRVGVTPAWAPFSYSTPSGQAAGIDVDILDLIATRTGLRFRVVPAACWDETLTLAETGEVDMTTGTSWTPARERLFQFTRPYYRSAVVIVTRQDAERFSHISLLRRASIAMPRRHIVTSAVIERLPSASMFLVNDQEECFEMVARKQADATVANVFTATQFLNEHPEARLKLSGVVSEFDFPLRMAVRRDQAALAGILDQALASISQEELDRIANKHLEFGLLSVHRGALLQRRAARILLFAAAGGAIALAWIWALRREVRARRRVEDQLRASNQSLEVFSHSIAHDLRAPLRAINGYVNALKEDYGGSISADAREMLDRILVSCRRMGILLRDVMTYNQANRCEAELQTVSLHALVQQLIAELPPEQRKHFHVEPNLPEVLAHPTLLAQSLDNLFSNAIKFVPPDRVPNVNVRAETTGGQVKLWVEDNGIGVDPEHRERIFELFARVAATEYPGTGIGLAIVAKCVERMGGQFGVEPNTGCGSRFWIALQRAPDRHAHDALLADSATARPHSLSALTRCLRRNRRVAEE